MNLDKNRLIVIGVAAFAVLVILANTIFVVDQRTQVLVLRFGEPQRVINIPGKRQAGLSLKTPFVENIVRFDRRNISLDTQGEEILVQNGARLVVDAFLRYRISDPLQYYRAFNTEALATGQIERLTTSSMREVLGRATVTQVVATDRAKLMQDIETDIGKRVRASKYGIEVLDLRLKRVDLPEANREAVYERMRTDRGQIAAQKKAEGVQEAAKIEAEARKLIGDIRGQADAERAKIFADSFGKDPSFAAFYRSMQAYDESLTQGDTTLVVSPDFLRYFTPSSR